jgi:hypothetical protein
VNNPNSDFYRAAVGVGLAIVSFLGLSLWSLKTGTRAVKKWATTKGLQIVDIRRRSFVPHWRTLPSRRFQFFRLTIRDKEGATHKAWMRVQANRTEPEILEIIWDNGDPLR